MSVVVRVLHVGASHCLRMCLCLFHASMAARAVPTATGRITSQRGATPFILANRVYQPAGHALPPTSVHRRHRRRAFGKFSLRRGRTKPYPQRESLLKGVPYSSAASASSSERSSDSAISSSDRSSPSSSSNSSFSPSSSVSSASAEPSAASSAALLAASVLSAGMKAERTDDLRAASANFAGLVAPEEMMRSRRSYSFWKKSAPWNEDHKYVRELSSAMLAALEEMMRSMRSYSFWK